ncbi:MAG: SCP2 sterol-binding domain-containing protein [Paracoccaceae bacterium]
MSDIITAAVTALSAKIASFDGLAKFVIPGEGAIMMDPSGVRAGDEDADVTMTADADVFKGILDGSVNPTMAFMSGKLTVDGNMGLAMKLAGALS